MQVLPRVSPQTAVSVFRRAAVGDKVVDEAQIRCPAALLLTIDFLFQRVLDADRMGVDARFGDGGVPTLWDIHAFLLDRTRAVRKECTMQNYVSKERNDALIMEVGRQTALMLPWRGRVKLRICLRCGCSDFGAHCPVSHPL